MPRYNPLIDRISTYPFVRILELKAERIAAGKPVYDFGMGDPVEPTPEFIRQALLGAVAPRCPYPTVAGRDGVRQAIADYVQRRFGVVIDPATQVVPTAGSKEAVFHLAQLVIDPAAADRTVIFPDPGYPAYQRGAMFAGADAHAVILDGDHVFRPWELDADLLSRTRLLWLNNPHNPSGAVTSLDQLRRIADVCRKYDILCVCDETYADVYDERYSEIPHTLLEAGVEGMLVLHSLSKRSGMTGYRSGFLAGDPAIIGKLKRYRANPGLVPQDFVNAAAQVAWSDDAHVAARRDVFNAKRKLFMDFFSGPAARKSGIQVVASEATIYLWLKVPAGVSDEHWAASLLDHGIVVSPGAMFGVAGGGRGHVRLALVPSMDVCRQAIEVWRSIL